MKKPFILAILAVVMWGTLAPINKLMLVSDIPVMEVLFVPSLLAAVFLFVLNIATGRIKQMKTYTVTDWLILAAFGLLGTFLYNMFYNTGIDRLTTQEACIINYLWPIMVMLFSCVFLGERMTVRKLIAILISFFGVITIVTKFDFKTLQLGSLPGVLACVAAAVCYGLFSVLNKKKSYDQYIALDMYYTVTVVASGIVLFSRHEFVMIHTPTQIGVMLWSGIIGSAISYLFWCLALVNGDTSKISNIAYVTPFMTILFSKIIVNESISMYSFLGLAFILIGIFLQMTGPSAKKETA